MIAACLASPDFVGSFFIRKRLFKTCLCRDIDGCSCGK